MRIALLWMLLCILPVQAQQTFSIQFEYDQLGQVSRFTYPDGSWVDFGYNNELGLASNIAYVSDGVTHPFISDVDLNASGLVTSVITDGGRKDYTFDSLDQLTSARFTHGGHVLFDANQMTYDQTGNLKSVTRDDPSMDGEVQFTYTEQGQLRTFQINQSKATYRYDKNGNLTSVSGFQQGNLSVSDQGTVEYDDKNHRDNWVYDQAGRVIQDDEYQYAYDPSGRVVLVRELRTRIPLFSYLYDGQGFRVRTTDIKQGSVTYSIRDSSGVIISEKIDRTIGPDETVTYIQQNGLLVGTIRHIEGNPTPIKTQIFQDHLGSPAVSVANGHTAHYEYGPFGQQLRAPQHFGAFGYTGHDDDLTGRTYMRARYYNPYAARFLTPDPARAFNVNLAATYNLYAYVSNNPINKTDPFGLVETGKQWANRLASDAFSRKNELQGYFYKGLSGFLGTADNISKVSNYWVFGKADELSFWDFAGAGAEFLDIIPGSNIGQLKSIPLNSSVVDGTTNFLEAAREVKSLLSTTGKAIHKIGKAGEDAVRSLYNIGKKQKIKINGRERIPDGITPDVLSEVKNVKYLSYTRQIRDYVDFAQLHGLEFDLYVRYGVKLSKPIRKAIDEGLINLRYIPNGK